MPGRLVAYARGAGSEVGDDGPEVVRPDAAQWHAEPGLLLEEIPLSWRYTLAAVRDEALPGLAASREGIEEAGERARGFVDTARRAPGIGGQKGPEGTAEPGQFGT
ncbi:hypothetical protein [Actinacidiphila glaucinigra]|uniref:Uncharacterized protein n=1 Tax=Actinacidiphila glaucinigra TaxID=235986 RepID=A0A239AYM1_9ACTN|nr:hypothetical protein [Actinacidiphila glaucinigra]SNS00114.1 hypothetical protein SAMN05216252_102228 [Actinacidiphila glaucinigra]